MKHLLLGLTLMHTGKCITIKTFIHAAINTHINTQTQKQVTVLDSGMCESEPQREAVLSVQINWAVSILGAASENRKQFNIKTKGTNKDKLNKTKQCENSFLKCHKMKTNCNSMFVATVLEHVNHLIILISSMTAQMNQRLISEQGQSALSQCTHSKIIFSGHNESVF